MLKNRGDQRPRPVVGEVGETAVEVAGGEEGGTGVGEAGGEVEGTERSQSLRMVKAKAQMK